MVEEVEGLFDLIETSEGDVVADAARYVHRHRREAS